MKRLEVLIVDDMKGSTKVDETQITELLKQINEKVDKVVINKVTIPTASEDENNLLGVHIIVREVAET